MRALERPAPLREGDLVALVAPSSGADADEVAAGVAALEAWGLRVAPAENLTSRQPGVLSFLAGDDAARARSFEKAWTDPEVRAVVCSRGGDGANRMVELVDWAAVRAAGPKALVGFSDVTTLHAALAVRCGFVSLHGPMPVTRAFGASAEGLRRMLFAPEEVRELRGAPGVDTLVGGRARGVLLGGCLSVFCAEFGTAAGPPDPRGALLCLEDVGENATHLDRYLGQLARSGYLDALAGVLLGSWKDCGPWQGELRELFLDRLGGLGVPVVGEFGFGHGEVNQTIPFGVEAELDADAGTLALQDF
ncbi:LD-carboxypeptidase [Mangrovactinospora gilvigrisea]|uniref:LD-carboxypeptidase n=1 Tax=Mangrovactinospora gilvigrisea TaxID=1428644 RepID=A0A1J7C1A2_9ACTN|nr:LD-carboxypeptidase [Mangrovactinospora gilvigrisea]OIV35348.1 LD-carboxypeptidase [Mangrovactinospora gilvigrisea]